ncbi:unnamed protein product [Paramecium sonneborni]|uniref:Kinesin motor domain-containing protein n=1 Tax=Paramecium sonneborni TaxID=65129 RepID=A0A8S1K9Y5_9CILI|nr:unnamed protein product [Paramecium sonneborni]
MQEPFKVSIRVKPYDGRSRFLTQRIGKETIIQVECPTQTIRDPDTYEQRSFAFDNVFNEGESTRDIYNSSIQQMIYDCVSQGYNGTVLAYGQTGSGKSYTMFGNLYDPLVENDGLVSMVLDQLFQMNVKISISYLEIYNEQIRDLIGDQVGLQLNEDPIKGVMLQDVQEFQILTIDQAKSIIINGNQKRVMAATNANQFSSRSHAIIQLFVVNQQYQCKLSLVDLAGSEKANVNEGSKGIRQMEGANINKSLLALGNCINMLACDQSMKKFVPYRDSKLTRLLKDSLGGNTKTLMIGCVQQVVQCHEETINTLKYAARARAIKKKIVQNIKINDVTNCNCNSENTSLLQAEIEALKQEVSFQCQLTEEEIEIRLNLKQIDQLQLQNREGLEYLLQQMNQEMVDEDRLKNEILQYERAINENERIRQELNSQLLSKKKERIDPKDVQIEMLKREITFLRDQIKQKDLVIDSLKIEKDNAKQQSRPHTSYQETDRQKMNKENSMDIDVRKDSLQYCGSTKSIKQTTTREDEQHLQKLNKARDNYKIFRAKMIQLQEKMNYYTKNEIQLNQNQLKEIIDLMNELSTQNGPVLKQDEEMIIYFQKFIKSQTQKSQQQINQNNNQTNQNNQITTPQQRSRSVNPNPIRGKGTSQHQRKPLQPTNQSPMNRQLFSNHSKQYQQLVQKGKKESYPTPQNKQKFILEYVKKMENQLPRGSNKSPLQSFSSENSDKPETILLSVVLFKKFHFNQFNDINISDYYCLINNSNIFHILLIFLIQFKKQIIQKFLYSYSLLFNIKVTMIGIIKIVSTFINQIQIWIILNQKKIKKLNLQDHVVLAQKQGNQGMNAQFLQEKKNVKRKLKIIDFVQKSLDLNEKQIYIYLFLNFIVYKIQYINMIFYKSLGKVPIFRFSTSVIEILNKFDEDYYVNNYLNTFNSTGFPQACLQIGNKNCNIIGLPRSGVQETIVDDLTDILLKDKKKNNFLVQIDPSPYLYTKRQLYKYYHSKVDPIITDNLFEQLPTLPIDTNELRLDLAIFDSINLIQQNPQLSSENKQSIFEYLNGQKLGYYQSTLKKLKENIQKNGELSQQQQKESDEMAKKFADLLSNTILYRDQNYNEVVQLSLLQALYMTTLKGANIYLIGMSQIYQRIASGIFLSLSEIQEMFNNICLEIQNKSIGENNLNYLFEFSTMLWKQKGIEYYLLFNINRYLKNTKENEVTVVVDALHYDPLRIAISNQKNNFIEEIENSYFAEFQHPKLEKPENDDQMIEKHAILSSILSFQIWKEPCINNPFPYLSVDFKKLNADQQQEIHNKFDNFYEKYSKQIQDVKNSLKQQ